LETRVLGQDRALELFERRTRLDPELIDQHPAGLLIALERVGLATAAVQREHQLGLQALAQRMLAHEPLQLARQPGVLPQRELRVDPILERGQALLPQPADLRPGEGLIRQIGERGSAPQPECSIEPLGRRAGIAGVERRASGSRELLEAVAIDAAGFGLQQITVAAGNEQVVTQRLAKARDIHVHRLGGSRRCPLAPQRIDQPVSRDHLSAMEQQHRQQRALLRTAERHRAIAIDHLKRSQNSKLNHARRPPVATLPPRGTLG
jgi:hypothetical protein